MSQRIVKRAFDVVISSVALAVFSPVFLVIALAIRITSRGPVLFRQQRVGLKQQPFTLFKFRSMVVDADELNHRLYVTALLTSEMPPTGGAPGVFKLVDDPRVTRVGRVLRRTSLDELPQLVNVLRGEMSLVGPRPCLQWEVDLYDQRYRCRFDVLPGVTGLWQVSGRSRVAMREALDLDVQYVQRQSLRLDLAIMARTLPSVVLGLGAH